MTSPLQLLFEAINQVQDETDRLLSPKLESILSPSDRRVIKGRSLCYPQAQGLWF